MRWPYRSAGPHLHGLDDAADGRPTALARLRADIRTATIPVVMLTANQQTGAVGEALVEGASCYVAKPFDTEVVTLVAKKFIAQPCRPSRASGFPERCAKLATAAFTSRLDASKAALAVAASV